MSNTSSKKSKKKQISGRQQMATETYEDKKYKKDFDWGNQQLETLDRKKMDVIKELAERLEHTGMLRTMISSAIGHMCKKWVSRAYLSLVLGDEFKNPDYVHKRELAKKRADKIRTVLHEDGSVTEESEESLGTPATPEPSVIEGRGQEDVFKQNQDLMKTNTSLELKIRGLKEERAIQMEKGWVFVPIKKFEDLQAKMRAEPKTGTGVYCHFTDLSIDEVLVSSVFERKKNAGELKDVANSK